MERRRTIQATALAALLAGAGVVSLLVLGHAGQVAVWLDLSAFPWANRFFDAGLVASVLTLTMLAGVLVYILFRPRPAPGRTAGTVMAEFVLVLPLLLIVAGTIVQLGLIANAALVVRYSAFTGARAAIVRFEPVPLFELDPIGLFSGSAGTERISETRADEVKRSVALVLATISPRTDGVPTDFDAAALAKIYNPTDSYRYAARVEYAMANTTVTVTDTPSPYKPDDLHLVAPLSGALAPVIPPPLIWEPPKTFELTLSLEKLIEILGGDSMAIGVFIFPIKILMNVVSNFLPPIGFSSPDNPDGFACQIDIGSLSVVIKIPYPPFLVDALTLRSDIHPFPEQVEVEVAYDFLITIPGMNLVPGLVGRAPSGVEGYGVFTLKRRVQLQSTGVREGSPLTVLYGDPSL